MGEGLYRQVRVLSLLYFLVVLPKELGVRERLDTVEFQKAWGFWSTTYEVELEPDEFIRRVRNAVSHGDVEFTDRLVEFGARKSKERMRLSLQTVSRF